MAVHGVISCGRAIEGLGLHKGVQGRIKGVQDVKGMQGTESVQMEELLLFTEQLYCSVAHLECSHNGRTPSGLPSSGECFGVSLNPPYHAPWLCY